MSYRSHQCDQLTLAEVDQKVILSGWVNSIRDHGGLIFIDLRDKYGLVQLSFNPSLVKESWQLAQTLHPEYVIKVKGQVLAREAGLVNSKIKTGQIEVQVSHLEILNKAQTLPFEISASKAVANENLRLKYRYLDLRRESAQQMLVQRAEFIQTCREYFQKNNFLEVQTPILANSSPEGARDWVVPSRLYPGQFYALPQAPQQFKQLLMVAGVDKYFQIAPCFRDEDPRHDRHYGEFYQLDMEMSFVEQADILELMEPLMIELTKKFSSLKVTSDSFQQIAWRDALTFYGSDKPDLRFDLKIEPVSDLFKETSFTVFQDVLQSGGVVHALKVEQTDQQKLSRKDIESLTKIAQGLGLAGLGYLVYGPEIKSPLLKFFQANEAQELKNKLSVQEGDLVFLAAGEWKTVCAALGAVRLEVSEKLALIDHSLASWLWVVDFPMFERDKEGKLDFAHNPFSMPHTTNITAENCLDVLAYQFDLVLNGYEVSSGAVRNHQPELLTKLFQLVGYSQAEIDQQFGHMMEAFSYGAPPHGGNAPGIDRLFMLLLGVTSIRDIYAFPKDGQGQDVMLSTPAKISPDQLAELSLKLDLKK